MLLEFTMIYESQPGGIVSAYVAEIPGVRASGQTLDETRGKLTEKLRYDLELERNHSITTASPDSRIEIVRVELPEAPIFGNRRAAVPVPSNSHPTDAKADLLSMMMEQGLIREMPTIADDDFQPIPFEGKPISEEILEERR